MTFKSDYLKYLILFSLPVLGFSLYQWFYYSFNHSIYFTCGMNIYLYKSFYPQCFFYLSFLGGLISLVKSVRAFYFFYKKPQIKLFSYLALMILITLFMFAVMSNIPYYDSVFICSNP